MLKAYDKYDTILMPLHAADPAYLSFEKAGAAASGRAGPRHPRHEELRQRQADEPVVGRRLPELRVEAAGEVRLVPEFMSPFASAVTDNRLRPFPSVPLRTVLTSFPVHGSPVARNFPGGELFGISRTLRFYLDPPDLLRHVAGFPGPRTTTRAPSPWGSRPVGDLAFLRCRTSERDLGRPLIPTPRIYLLVSHRADLPCLTLQQTGTR